MNDHSKKLPGLTLGFIFVACLSYHLFYSLLGWHHGISDIHGFRQTQTAITAYYLLKGGPILAYLTPVLGPPWTIPFEFPLYQLLVAICSKITTYPLNETGRFVSLTFFYLSLIALNFLMLQLSWPRTTRVITLCLALLSPLYLFWSRTFMIESTALFFSILYLALGIRVLRRFSYFGLAATCLVGVLGALVKITTFIGFSFPMGIFFLASLFKSQKPFIADFWQKPWRRDLRQYLGQYLGRYLAMSIALFIIPVVTGWIWTHFTDVQKGLSPYSAWLESKNLQAWNFGTLRMRLSSATWDIFYRRTIMEILGKSLVPQTLLIPLFIFPGRRKEALFF